MTSRLFGIGVQGTALTPIEREILAKFPPWSVILFRRNIESLDQVRDLVSEIRALPGSPRLCVDQEGGPVDRFRDLFGPSISFRQASEAGLARRAGELAGEACARLGFDVDLAPVVDRRLPGAAEKVLKDRCASANPDSIVRSARQFLAGLHARGVGGCVKHFPGLGRAELDTHKDLPRIPADLREEERDLSPFAATMGEAGAVMISHAAGPEGDPASLSRAKAQRLLRERLGFAGAAFSDDLEMGALTAFGDLPERCVLASRAGCDLLFVCSLITIFPECAEAVERKVPEGRRAEATARLERYGDHLAKLRRGARTPDRPVAELELEIRALREQFSLSF